jgi:hypothetical protein
VHVACIASSSEIASPVLPPACTVCVRGVEIIDCMAQEGVSHESIESFRQSCVACLRYNTARNSTTTQIVSWNAAKLANSVSFRAVTKQYQYFQLSPIERSRCS